MAIGLKNRDNLPSGNTPPSNTPFWEKPIFRKIITGILVILVVECVLFLGGVIMAKNLGIF